MRVARRGQVRAAVVLAAGLAALSCSRKAEPAKAAFDTGVPLAEVMAHVVQPAALKFWGGSGSIYDKSGLRDLRPTTPEAWKSVEDGAVGVIEASNLLRIPGRARAPLPEWDRYVEDLNKVGKDALAAVETRDDKAMMQVGSRMDLVCDNCHERFMTPEQRGEAPAKGATAAKPGRT